MKYLIIDSNFLDLSAFQQNLVKMFIEIDNSGSVKREIGFNLSGQVVHAYPSRKYSYGKYGIFDLATFDMSSIMESQLSKEEFEKIWITNNI